MLDEMIFVQNDSASLFSNFSNMELLSLLLLEFPAIRETPTSRVISLTRLHFHEGIMC